MSKHTPGPWESIRTTAPRGWIVTANDRAYDLAIVRDGSGMTENESNARLIAAAPDLLETSRRLAWIRENGCSHEEYEESIRAHDAAIAKATGAQP
jgi:hypothetical protein